jgi:hypothetical protein
MRRGLIAVHLVLAPILFVPLLDVVGPVDRGARAIAGAVPTPAPGQVVILNTPIELVSMIAWELLLQRDPRRATPTSLQQLYAGAANLQLQRIDERTLELRPEGGWGRRPIERLFTSLEAMPRVGSTQRIDGMQVTVRESEPDGRPRAVQFRFPDALEASERLWLEWRGTELHPWTPPAIGQTVALEPLSMLRSFPR